MSTEIENTELTSNDAKPMLYVRSCVLEKQDMGDDLCKYCPLDKKGVYGVDGGYMAGCEGSRCEEAYENYLDEHLHKNDV